MAQPLEFWFEFASTYSYPAAMEVEDACRESGVRLIWRPFLLGPVFAAQGMNASPFQLYPVKGAYMWRDMERICADAGLQFARPSRFPRGSLLAARIASCFADAPWAGLFIRSVYVANFADDQDIGDEAVILDLLEKSSPDPTAVMEAALTTEGKSVLRRQTETAEAKGIFGAPSMTIGDELFWGRDRLRQAVAWAAGT